MKINMHVKFYIKSDLVKYGYDVTNLDLWVLTLQILKTEFVLFSQKWSKSNRLSHVKLTSTLILTILLVARLINFQ